MKLMLFFNILVSGYVAVKVGTILCCYWHCPREQEPKIKLYSKLSFPHDHK